MFLTTNMGLNRAQPQLVMSPSEASLRAGGACEHRIRLHPIPSESLFLVLPLLRAATGLVNIHITHFKII